MKVKISQENFSKLLGLVTGVVPTTSSIPVLSNLLIETEGDRVKVSATDLDISVISLLDCEILKKGSITVGAKRFQEIVRELPGEEVDLEVDGNRITIICSRANFRMMGMEKDQFPKIADLEKEEKISISAAALEKMIRRSIYSVARDDTRPVLSGVLWELSPKELAMVGTDGHRLARMAIKGDFPVKEEMGVIIPPKALNQVLRLIGGTGEVGIAMDKAFVGFFVGDTIVYTRRIEGTFPNYKQVIPSNNENVLVIDRGALMSAAKRVSLLADSKTHKIKVHLTKNKIKLTASTPDLGEAEEEVPASYSGEEMVIGYNASYLLDVLKNSESDEMKLELGTSVGASILKQAEEPDDESYVCLVMPLRLAEQE
ncbi:MAG: DNA polymerase III subunit beta [Candidatus Eisenbacteria bacterium]